MFGAHEMVAVLIPFVLKIRQPARGRSHIEIGDRIIALNSQRLPVRGEGIRRKQAGCNEDKAGISA